MFTFVNFEDAEMVLSHCWQAHRGRNTWYAVTDIRANKRPVKTFLHRKLLQCLPGTEVDHINGNGLDNRRKNLRPSTRSQNAGNSRLRRDSTSGFKGVYWSKDKRKWHVSIGHRKHSKHIHVGYFDDLIEAAKAYNAAALAKWGEFARPNILPDNSTPG